MAFLCVDIGGTNTLIGVGNGDFEIVKKVKSQDFLNDIGTCLENTLSKEKIEAIDRVAVAAAGPIDREKGVFYPPNLPIGEVKIKKPLSEFGEVKIINDCTAAVLGEYHYGDHNSENLVYVTISSGIGAGVIINGKPVEGWNGNFGEVGHMQLEENGLECGCGLKGHWEAYCSGNSLPQLGKHLNNTKYENAVEVFQEYENGDQNAAETIERMKELNAEAFGNLISMYNPEKIVVGGAVALNHPETVVEPLERQVKEKTVNNIPSIELCKMEDESVLHGLRAACNGADI